MSTRFASPASLTHRLCRCLAWLSVALAGCMLLASCGTSDGGDAAPAGTAPVSAGLHGTVHGGQPPIVGSTVLIYSTSLTVGAAPQEIANTTTDSHGNWGVSTFSPNPGPGQVVYVVSLGGNPGSGTNANAALITAAVVDINGNLPNSLVVNELTTVATASQLQNYMTEVDCSTITGTTITSPGQNCPSIAGATGLAARAGTINNLVNLASGLASSFLSGATSGSALNKTYLNLNFQASVLAACINSTGGISGDGSVCGKLFALEPTNRGTLTPVSGSAFSTGSSTISVAVTPNGNFAYVANQLSSGTVSAYAIGSSGALTAISGSPFASGWNPGAITVSPNGAFAYVANTNGGSGTVSAYTINSSTGALTAVSGSPFALPVGGSGDGYYPDSITVSPNGAFLFVADQGGINNVTVFSINSSTGALTLVGDYPATSPSGAYPSSVAVSPNNEFAYVTNYGGGSTPGSVSVLSIDSSTGALTAIAGSPYTAGIYAGAVTISPNGAFAYVANSGAGTVSAYTVNSSTGALTAVSGSPFAAGASPNSVTVSANGDFAYVANKGSPTGSISTYSINSSTGALTAVTGSPFTAGTTTESGTLTSNGQFVLAANVGDATVSVYSTNATTDTITAALTMAQQPGSNISSLFALLPGSPVFTPVPGSAPGSLTVGGTEFAYVANYGSNTVSAFSTNNNTGTLTALSGSPFSTGTNPQSVTVSPTGEFAYVANYTDGTVSAYTIDPATGTLTAVSGSPFTTGTGPRTVTVSPNGAFAYVANEGSSNVSAYTINSSTGVLTAVSGSPFTTGGNTWSVAVSPNGAFAYVGGFMTNAVGVYSINSSTGALTSVSSTTIGPPNQVHAASIVFSPNGDFVYIANESLGKLSAYTANSGTGALTAISGQPFASGSAPYSAAVSPNSAFVYAANLGADDISAFTINSGTGALTAVSGSPFSAGTFPRSVTVSPTGAYAYVANEDDNTVGAYSINSSTGALTAISGSPFSTATNPESVVITP